MTEFLQKYLLWCQKATKDPDLIKELKEIEGNVIAEVEDILAKAEEKGEAPFIIILDGIEDPHNLGALIRTAECAGCHGVIIPKRRAVGVTEVVAKTSVGATQYVPIVRVNNINETMKELQDRGVWIVGTDGSAG